MRLNKRHSTVKFILCAHISISHIETKLKSRRFFTCAFLLLLNIQFFIRIVSYIFIFYYLRLWFIFVKKLSRKRESGAFYKKQAKEKAEKNEEVVRKMPKLDSFFLKENKNENESVGDKSVVDIEQPMATSSTTDVELNKVDNADTCEIKQKVNEQSVSAPLEIDKITVSFNEAPATWVISEELKQYFITHGVKQRIEILDFKKSKREYNDHARYCSQGMFKTRLKNNETITRDYLIYSCGTGRLYCLPCRLFGGTGKEMFYICYWLLVDLFYQI